MRSMLPYMAAPWIRHGYSPSTNGMQLGDPHLGDVPRLFHHQKMDSYMIIMVLPVIQH